MAMPPIVGVPALATWVAGPSSRMYWPISRVRKYRMRKGVERMASQSAMPPETSSPSTCRQGSGCRSCPAGAQDGRVRPVTGRQRVTRLVGVVEGDPLSPDLLVRLVPFSRQHDHVTRRGGLEGAADRHGALGLDDHGRVVTPTRDAAQYLVDDGGRLLVARVVRRHDRHVAQADRCLTHERTLGPVAVAATPEHGEHPATGCEGPRLAEHHLQAGGRVGVVDDHGERRRRVGGPATRLAPGRRRDHLEAPRHGRDAGHGPRDVGGVDVELVERQRRLRRQERVVHIHCAGQRRRDALPAPGERGLPGLEHDVRGVAVPHRDDRDPRAFEQPSTPRIVSVDDAAQRAPRVEQGRLCLEVVLHRPVVVEVVMAQVGEDRDVEVDALHPRLDQRVARDLHRNRVAHTVGHLPVTDAGQDPLHLGGLRRGADARQRPHHVGRMAQRTQGDPRGCG